MKKKKTGRGLISTALKGVGKLAGTVLNKGIDLLPYEFHAPGGYSYCGPGTKLKERLARGDKPINGLDEACKAHDIAYAQYSDSARRSKADKELAERAWLRFKSSDSSLGEKATAWAVTTAMKAKAKLGGGHKKRRRRRTRTGKGLYLRPWVTSKSRGGGIKKKRGAGARRCKCKKKKSSK